MSSVNKVILIGNLGADPELRYLPDGAAVCNLSIATTEKWKDKASSEARESTEWHRVVLYRKLGEISGQYLRKGSSVFIEGRLKTRKWQDRGGQDRYTTEIEASAMQMLDSRSSGHQSDARVTVATTTSPVIPLKTASYMDDLDDYPF